MYGVIILAGGRSSRMGKDKASLTVDGKSLLERTILLVKPLVGQTVVMLAEKQEIPNLTAELRKKIVVGRDRKHAKGPLQGICDGSKLLNRDISKIFILSCDLPYLNTNWLKKLQKRMTDNIDVVCTVNGKITNPLIALYRRNVLEGAEQAIQQGKRRPIDLWAGFHVDQLIPSNEEAHTVSDMNTPEEYQKAAKHYDTIHEDR